MSEPTPEHVSTCGPCGTAQHSRCIPTIASLPRWSCGCWERGHVMPGKVTRFTSAQPASRAPLSPQNASKPAKGRNQSAA